MGKHAQLIMGPAGSGKSTYCDIIRQHCENIGRSVHVINLDPAADNFKYPVSIDIRDLISLDDVVEEMDLGPNGGLVFCMEYLMENIEWFRDKIENFSDDYIIIDCPGQIELYSHLPVLNVVCEFLQQQDYNVCGVFLLDALFMTDPSKFISGTLVCLSAMIQLELPHINLITKCDLLTNERDKEQLDMFLEADVTGLIYALNKDMDPKYHALNVAIGELIEEYNMVGFIALDRSSEESIALVLAHIDHSIQYGEDLEIKDSLNKEDVEM